MAGPADLVRAWQDAVQRFRKVAAPNLDQSTLRQLIAPRQRSGDRGAGQAAARPNGLPSGSLQIAHLAPGWTIVPPSART